MTMEDSAGAGPRGVMTRAWRGLVGLCRRVGVTRGYLLGLLVVAPVSFWIASAETWTRYASGERLWPVSVAKGASAEYADATWRLVGLDVDKRLETGPNRSIALPDGLSIVRVRLEMTARSADAIPALARCTGTLRDSEGRRWDANPSELSGRARTMPSNCSSWRNRATRQTENVEAGKPWQFELAFLVPDKSAAEATPEITLARALPRYLRFQR